jgi:hypothetical protein
MCSNTLIWADVAVVLSGAGLLVANSLNVTEGLILWQRQFASLKNIEYHAWFRTQWGSFLSVAK